MVWYAGPGGAGLGTVAILRYDVNSLPSHIQNRLPLSPDDGASLFIQYAHLNSIQVAPGNPIPEDFRVGLSGATGGEYVPHLDLTVIWIPNSAARGALGIYFDVANNAMRWDELTTNNPAYNARWTIDPLDLWSDMRWDEVSREVPTNLCQPAECRVYRP